jgi:hypothetical protein
MKLKPGEDRLESEAYLANSAAPGASAMAFSAGQVEHRRGPAVTWRLVVRKVEMDGRWLCLGRRFVRLGEAAEEL